MATEKADVLMAQGLGTGRLFPVFAFPRSFAWREWAVVVAIVVALHWVLLAAWVMHPVTSGRAASDQTVTVTLESAAISPPSARPAARTMPVSHQDDAAPRVPDAPTTAPQPAAASAEVPAPNIPDVEPDYHAAYLNNPAPTYPLAARRRGLQGRVVLNVEVLADGGCGQVNIQQSSGHEMLDNAALQTVKGWRFVPARHLGLATSKWFLVPIQFSLKDDAA